MPPRATSFSCRTYRGVTGPNWIIAGEAASMVDPITSNGVTSALRHAQEASALIVRSRGKSELQYLARKSYSMRVLQLGRFFNSGIEWLVYDWQVRDRVGIERAATIYTDAAWSMNALYSRLGPRGVLSTAAFGALLNVPKSRLKRLDALPSVRQPWVKENSGLTLLTSSSDSTHNLQSRIFKNASYQTSRRSARYPRTHGFSARDRQALE